MADLFQTIMALPVLLMFAVVVGLLYWGLSK